MKKLPIVMTLIAFLALVILTALAQAMPENGNDKYVHTKAICKGNYCIDIEITCYGGEIVDIVPIPHGVYFSSDWSDPRPEETRDMWCGHEE